MELLREGNHDLQHPLSRPVSLRFDFKCLAQQLSSSLEFDLSAESRYRQCNEASGCSRHSTGFVLWSTELCRAVVQD